nr:transposase [Nitriliruptor alkaliphilus]
MTPPRRYGWTSRGTATSSSWLKRGGSRRGQDGWEGDHHARTEEVPDELRDRAVRLVAEDGQHGAIARVAARLDINPETLRNWVKRERRRVEQPETVDLEAENRRLRRQVADLERDKEILKAASSFFARELDRPQRR